MRVRRMVAAGAAAALLGGGVPAHAQAQAAADSSKRAPLFEGSDLYWAAGFAAATVAVAPLDRQLARTLQRPAVQANRILSKGSVGARLLGSPGAEILGGLVYGAGRLSGNRGMATVGLHTAEAVFIGDMISGGIKMAAGRRRPYLSPDNPYDFRLFRGIKGDSVRSFPSGHTTSAFAAAAAATAETAYRWKAGKPFVAPVLYGAAGIVGLSRMYNNAHWASDVAVGAAIGSFVGWKVTRYAHDHPTNSVDNFFLGRPKATSGTAANASRSPARSRSRTLFGGGIPISFSIP
ncbi:MAG TPA: phosphatase PAP2 family protein, partial [Longimicrobium sp.]|nr:phosphatase PAP2 family protein [Longimicrobium sp.]